MEHYTQSSLKLERDYPVVEQEEWCGKLRGECERMLCEECERMLCEECEKMLCEE